MDADLDRGVCARVTCVGRDRSDSRLGDLETGERTAAFKHDGLVTPTHPTLLCWLHD